MFGMSIGPIVKQQLRWLPLLVALFAIGGGATASAQEPASIIGQIVDDSGGVLPGVTVIATSPALQVERVSAVTDARGEYRLTPLPIGTYSVRYELSGFESIQREGIRLTGGFVATLNMTLKIGTVEQSIVVSGQSPVVDVTTASSKTTFQREALEELPTTRNSILSLTQQAPGIRTSASGFDIGGNQFTGGPALNSFGRSGDNWEMLDGVLTTSAAQTNEGVYWDFSTYEEATVQTSGKSAEVPASGVYINSILKSGGNAFHGSAYYALTGPWAQSDNIDTTLQAQGVSGTNTLLKRYDVSGDLGGRLVRDKLWFYANSRRAYDDAQAIGCFKEDGSSCDNPKLQRFITGKISYQMNPSNKLVVMDQWNGKFNVRATNLTGWESRVYQDQVGHTRKADWNGIFSDTVTASAMVGYWNYRTPLLGEAYGKVGTFDQVTQKYTGDEFWLTGPAPIDAQQYRYQAKATLSWFKKDFLKSNHDVKVGWEYTPGTYGPWSYQDRGASESYYLILRSGAPFQLATWNIPVAPTARADYVGAFAQDNWMMGRLTLNVGLRYDRNRGYNPAQDRVAGPFAAAASFPAVEFPVWNAFAPRIHAALDLTGHAQTVIKGGWSRYNKMRATGEILTAGLNSLITTTYTWHDNGNKVFDPGEVNFDLNGTDFVSQTGGATEVINPNEREPKVDEFSLDLEHQLLPNFALRFSAVYARQFDNRLLVGVSRPFSAYSIPISKPDPGPDGVLNTADDTGQSLTYYEYPTALRPASFALTTPVNDPIADGTYKAAEISATKRSSNNWQMMAALGGIWPNTPFRTDFPAYTPNALIYGADTATRWYGKVGGSYRFSRIGVLAAANFNAVSGEPFQRTVSVTGGSTITSFAVPTEPFGAEKYPNAYLLDVRGEKSIKVSNGQKLSLRADLFNALNSNVITSWTTTSGANFKKPTTIMPGRIVVFSFSYAF